MFKAENYKHLSVLLARISGNGVLRQALSNSVLVVIAATLTRCIPIISGVYVVRLYGELAFKSFSLLLVSLTLALVLISAGVCPGLIRDISKCVGERQRRLIVGNFVSVSVVSTMVMSSLMAWRFISVSPIPVGFLSAVLVIGAVFGTAMYLIAITTLQTIERALPVVYIGIGHALVCGVLMLIVFNDYQHFLQGYLLAYVLLGFTSYLCLYFSTCRPVFRWRRRALTKTFTRVVRSTGLILAANVIWSIGIFTYHYWLAQGGVVINDYVLFGIGYQWFGVLIFIPGALSPVLVPLFVRNGSRRLLLLTCAFFLVIDLIIVSILLYNGLLLKLLYGLDMNAGNLSPFYFALLAGAIASMNAPAIQYLFSRQLTVVVVIASCLWCAVLSLCVAFDSDRLVFAAFPIAYLVSFIVLALGVMFGPSVRHSEA